MLKFTQYFAHMKQRADRAIIDVRWIEQTVSTPEYTKAQEDGRIRKWRFIESEGKYLRVILLPDGETVHNAFFDRTFKGEVK